MAFRAVGHPFTRRLNGPRVPSWKTGAQLGITASARLGKRYLSVKALSYATLQTVVRYCHSDSETIEQVHVPPLRGLELGRLPELAQIVLPFARKAWADLLDSAGGIVRFTHDHYLKMWALTEPVIPGDFLMLDEAQDTNPVVEKVVLAQRAHM
jgi:hypothetical protein